MTTSKQQIKDEVDAQIDRIKSLPELVLETWFTSKRSQSWSFLGPSHKRGHRDTCYIGSSELSPRSGRSSKISRDSFLWSKSKPTNWVET